MVTPKVVRREGRKVSGVDARLSIFPRKVRRILRSRGYSRSRIEQRGGVRFGQFLRGRHLLALR
jgi:hypothetical protein